MARCQMFGLLDWAFSTASDYWFEHSSFIKIFHVHRALLNSWALDKGSANLFIIWKLADNWIHSIMLASPRSASADTFSHICGNKA